MGCRITICCNRNSTGVTGYVLPLAYIFQNSSVGQPFATCQPMYGSRNANAISPPSHSHLLARYLRPGVSSRPMTSAAPKYASVILVISPSPATSAEHEP